MYRFWGKWLLVLAAVGCLTVTLVLVLGYRWLHTPLSLPEQSWQYDVKSGQSLIQVSRELGQQDILSYSRLLPWYARLQGRANIKTGEYLLHANDTPASLLNKLYQGDVITYSVTLVEGWTFRQALEHLQTQPKLELTLADSAQLNAFIADLELPNDHPEGWFFPDTYDYPAGTSDRSLLTQAHRRMRDILASEWATRVGGLPYETPYQALIMASIVERETGAPHERGEIAGVFVRRLERNMRLQTDPTVIYGLGEDYEGNIRRRHLSQVTPYNTYRIKGLPPTPIALPGQQAIHAALNPKPGETLYFVARGDGSHHFSKTLAEHNKAVRKYQIEQRADDYRSAPMPADDTVDPEEDSNGTR